MTILTENARGRIVSVFRTRKQNMVPEEVSRLSGVPLWQTHKLLTESPEFRAVGRLFAWTPKPKQVAEQAEAAWKNGHYTGEKPIPMRPGSEDFLQCHSLENGQRVPRKRPVLISYRDEQ